VADGPGKFLPVFALVIDGNRVSYIDNISKLEHEISTSF
jgi:hypothetical protein